MLALLFPDLLIRRMGKFSQGTVKPKCRKHVISETAEVACCLMTSLHSRLLRQGQTKRLGKRI